jgi:hypothetical protein
MQYSKSKEASMFLYTGPEAMYLAKNGFINPTKPESLN